MKQFSGLLGASALVLALATVTAPSGYAYTHVRRGPTAPSNSRHHAAKHPAKLTGPRAMDSERATAIQTALIKSGYMTGTPSGHWDADSEAAIRKMQADNGWQTKITPDSRALIKLGLGPKPAEGAPAAAATGSETSTGAEVGGVASARKVAPEL